MYIQLAQGGGGDVILALAKEGYSARVTAKKSWLQSIDSFEND